MKLEILPFSLKNKCLRPLFNQVLIIIPFKVYMQQILGKKYLDWILPKTR